ncbi:putative transcriptional regulator (plasmid) [Phaeobacter inhibens]|uniref:helix-turn-helix domain-containing protein n=1 Tax=Phaeobacter inhibens TaxID=221822 RepID=UPI000C9A305D|nr:hypothetical protein [Phaeobacter inhibens]AUQ92777.1 putative transcriptional regulator [Phaeobacter inhibens]
MPIAIAFSNGGTIPAIIQEATAADLVKALDGLKEAPTLQTEEQAREWLQTLPMPSGWFETISEAKAHLARWKEPTPLLTKEQVRAAREDLGMSQADFAAAVGIGGNPDTRRRYMVGVERGEIQPKTNAARALSVDATRRLRALMAEKGLEISDE